MTPTMTLYEQLQKPTFLFDSHAHLNFEGYDEKREELIMRAKENGVEQIFDIAVDIESSKKSLEISKQFLEVKSFIGIDPECFIPGSELFIGLEQSSNWFENNYDNLDKLITDNRQLITGIGESGMDDYWLNRQSSIEDRKLSLDLQERLLRLHLDLATKHNLPLSIHSRGAEQRCLEIVSEYKSSFGIFHSYAGSIETAKSILDKGWGLGVNGIVTFKNGENIREIYRNILGKISSDWNLSDFYQKGIYFETDSPFLAPEGKRGEQNVPANVRIVYDRFVEMLQA